jgi:hypothetical protein
MDLHERNKLQKTYVSKNTRKNTSYAKCRGQATAMAGGERARATAAARVAGLGSSDGDDFAMHHSTLCV